MKPLEDILRDLATSGRLNHISIAWLHGGGYEVAYRGQAHTDHGRTTHSDVVCALQAALTGSPGNAAVKKTRSRQQPQPVTLPDATDEDILV